MGSSPILTTKNYNMIKSKIQNFGFALTALGVVTSLVGIVTLNKFDNLYVTGMAMGSGISLALVGLVIRLLSNKM
jgi:flagellar motor component MotA